MNKPVSKTTKAQRKSSTNSGQKDTRLDLVKAATRLFAKQGLKGTSIRDIAGAAKVNSSMISYYFGGKEELYRQCVKQIGESHFTYAKKILTPPDNLEDYKVKLKLFIDNIFNLLLDDRNAGLILMREFDRVNSPASQIFKRGFLSVFNVLIDFFKQAQEKKIINKQHDPYLLTSVLLGSITNQMRMDHITEKTYGRTLKDIKTRAKTEEQLILLFTSL